MNMAVTNRRCPAHGEYHVRLYGKRVLGCCPECVTEAEDARTREETRRQAVELERRKSANLVLAKIPFRFKDASFLNYEVEHEGQGIAKKKAEGYAASFPSPLRNAQCMIFSGDVGTGKTHLAVGAIKEVVGMGFTARYVLAADLIQAMKRPWNDHSVFEGEIIAEFAAPDLLVVDEVGVQFEKDYERTLLARVFGRRYDEKKPCLLLSNLPHASPNEDAVLIRHCVGDRVYDRLREGVGQLVVFDWPSYRK